MYLRRQSEAGGESWTSPSAYAVSKHSLVVKRKPVAGDHRPTNLAASKGRGKKGRKGREGKGKEGAEARW